MKAFYFGLAVTVVLELGQLALVNWCGRELVVEVSDLRRVSQ